MDDSAAPDPQEIANDFTKYLIQQCSIAEANLATFGLDPAFIRILSIQSIYNTFKYLASTTNNKKTQEQLYEIFAEDAKNIVFHKEPNVPYVGVA